MCRNFVKGTMFIRKLLRVLGVGLLMQLIPFGVGCQSRKDDPAIAVIEEGDSRRPMSHTESQLTGIAVVNCSDRASIDLIQQVLADSKIECYIEGSLRYGVLIDRKQLAI